MSLREKRRSRWETARRPNHGVYRRRRHTALLALVALAVLVVGGGAWAYTSSLSSDQDQQQAQDDQQASQDDNHQQQEQTTTSSSDNQQQTQSAPAPPPPPQDKTLYLTVPRLGLYNNTVRNDRSEASLDLGAIKLPETGFPWEGEGTNTYIACHRLGWPGTESYHQCLNLPSMQKGDEVDLADTNGTTYRYKVSEILQVRPDETWVTQPSSGGEEVVSLQTCIEVLGDVATLGPTWSARIIVRATRVA